MNGEQIVLMVPKKAFEADSICDTSTFINIRCYLNGIYFIIRLKL